MRTHEKCQACKGTGSDHLERQGAKLVNARCDVCGGSGSITRFLPVALIRRRARRIQRLLQEGTTARRNLYPARHA